MDDTRVDEPSGHELIVGLVGAIGADMEAVSLALKRAFEDVDYHTRDIRLIEEVANLNPRWQAQPGLTLEELYTRRMDAGNEVRRLFKRKDALALLAIMAIHAERKTHNALVGAYKYNPIKRCAYILRSLKTPEEAETLRQVYGNNCLVIGAYASKKDREKKLADRIAASHFEPFGERFSPAAKQLIVRDEREHGEEYGQNVRGAFAVADAFLNASGGADALHEDARRLVDLLFGHPFRTPTRDECGMFQAHGAGLRSASAGRQVGAAIATPGGDIVSVGTNEVARAFGGQYWGEDKVDHRDHKRPVDSNAAMARNIVADLLVRLKKKGWLDGDHADLDADALLRRVDEERVLDAFSARDADEEGLPSLAESARVKHALEYMRPVHAEMAALISAARRGVAVDGCTIYSTTFPCHECAKHIVAAGIRRVVFVEPYPKSRVADMYDDSIAIDDVSDTSRVAFQPFIGIAPRRYVELFTAPRRSANGVWVDWNKIRRHQDPRIGGPIRSYIDQEIDYSDMTASFGDALIGSPEQASGDANK